MPQTDQEIRYMKDVAGLYHHGTVEVWSLDSLKHVVERGTPLIALEMDKRAIPLGSYVFPAERPFFIVGPFNGTLPQDVLDLADATIQIESPRDFPLKPWVAAGIALRQQYVSREAVSVR